MLAHRPPGHFQRRNGAGLRAFPAFGAAGSVQQVYAVSQQVRPLRAEIHASVALDAAGGIERQ
jgi:hypothetical protein